MKKIIQQEVQVEKFEGQEVFAKKFEGYDAAIRFSDLPKDLLDTDIIHIRRKETYSFDDDSYEAYTELLVIRERKEDV